MRHLAECLEVEWKGLKTKRQVAGHFKTEPWRWIFGQDGRSGHEHIRGVKESKKSGLVWAEGANEQNFREDCSEGFLKCQTRKYVFKSAKASEGLPEA